MVSIFNHALNMKGESFLGHFLCIVDVVRQPLVVALIDDSGVGVGPPGIETVERFDVGLELVDEFPFFGL